MKNDSDSINSNGAQDDAHCSSDAQNLGAPSFDFDSKGKNNDLRSDEKSVIGGDYPSSDRADFSSYGNFADANSKNDAKYQDVAQTKYDDIRNNNEHTKIGRDGANDAEDEKHTQKTDLKNAGDAGANKQAKSGAKSDAETSSAINRVEAMAKKAPKTQKDVADKRKKNFKKRNVWWIKASVISLVLAAFFSFLSELTADAEHIIVIILLLAFLILASILFDSIGVAVTSCEAAPIISMASRKIYGARTAMWLVKNSGTVSSVCNDVIGDIFGIISGACSAAIVIKITAGLETTGQKLVSIAVSAVVSALTIGGKAFMKNIAISNSKDFVMFVARVLAIFNSDERKIRKKEAKKNKTKQN